MKKTFFLVMLIAAIASCSKKEETTQSITGKWEVYKYVKDGIDWTQYSPYKDSIVNYTITFAEGGTFLEKNYFPPDTDSVYLPGTWQFQDRYQKLLLNDTVYGDRLYYVFNLEGNHVELRRGGVSRYLRKL
jgi:hypothetical protein